MCPLLAEKCVMGVYLAPPFGSLQNKIRSFNQTKPCCHSIKLFYKTAGLSNILGSSSCLLFCDVMYFKNVKDLQTYKTCIPRVAMDTQACTAVTWTSESFGRVTFNPGLFLSNANVSLK